MAQSVKFNCVGLQNEVAHESRSSGSEGYRI